MEEIINTQNTYSTKFFYDSCGRKINYKPVDKCRLGDRTIPGTPLKLWHVEYCSDPKLCYEETYLSLPMPDISSTGDAVTSDWDSLENYESAILACSPAQVEDEKPLTDLGYEILATMYYMTKRPPYSMCKTRLLDIKCLARDNGNYALEEAVNKLLEDYKLAEEINSAKIVG